MFRGSLLQQGAIVFGSAVLVFLAILWWDPFPGLQEVRFGAEEEKALGDLLARSYFQQWDTLPNETYAETIDPIMHRLREVLPPGEIPITLHVMDGDMVNAFASLGGHIFLFRGLIEQAGSREEIASVIAHEIAHVRLKHVRKQILRSAGIAIVASAMGGDGNAILNLTANITSNAFSRKYEAEADAFAFRTLVAAGIRPSSFASFLTNARAAFHGGVPEFLSTHPSDESRIKRAYDYPLPDGFVERPL